MINPKPKADFKTDDFLCEKGNAEVINTSDDYTKGFTKVDWNTSTNYSVGNPDTFRFALNSPAYQNVRLIVESSDGCGDTISKNIKLRF